MIKAITEDTIDGIGNPVMRSYAKQYIEIERSFKEQVASFGLPFSDAEDTGVFSSLANSLARKGVKFANCSKSLHVGWLSPSCVICRRGLNTATFLLSVQCPNNCFFCFNPNQIDYENLLINTKDVIREIEAMHAKGARLDDIALTGGEPLVHKPEAIAFFRQAKRLYPHAYTRLYTSGAFLDEATLKELESVGLDEIRFSIKMEEPESIRTGRLEVIERSKAFIPAVVVEMPVMPDGIDEMKRLLVDLDERGIAGINLLELCYPLHNADEFSSRGYAIKETPYRVLYDYWYAGGLPIAGSEHACLKLLEFACDSNLSLGVHYCSLENKFSGQIYLQNKPFANRYPLYTMSPTDHFLKVAKAFGSDASLLKKHFDHSEVSAYRFDSTDSLIEFPPSLVASLRSPFPTMEIAISYNVVERNDKDLYLKEVRLDSTAPAVFDPSIDI